MRVLVTGGSGFIGAWIARRLKAKGAHIRVLDLKDDRRVAREIMGAAADAMEWRTGDIANRDTVAAAAEGMDLIIHLAAVLTPACQTDPIRGAEINLMGSLNVFEAARKHGIKRVLYMSSAGVFGPDDGVTPRPTTHYGAFKLAMEGSARAYAIDHGIASIGYRPLVVYGPGRETGLTAGPTLACKAAARGENYVIPFTGETDFVWVDDVAAAYDAAASTPFEGARVYNIVGEVQTAETFATALSRAAGVSITANGPLLPVAARLEPGTLLQDFPGLKITGIADGIAATLAHYRGQPNRSS